MAVIKDFEVQVLVEGEAAHEYEDDDDDGDNERPRTVNTISKYVEAAPGATFAFKMDIKPGFSYLDAHNVLFQVHLDGEAVRSPVVSKARFSKVAGYSQVHKGVKSREDGGWVFQKFKFNNTTTRELANDEDIEALKTRYNQLGDIRIEVWRQKGKRSHSSLGKKPTSLQDAVPEKALKGRALALATSFGEARKVRAPHTSCHGKKLDSEPIAVFIFKYRSKEALKHLLVIPRTPSPIPLEERSVEDLGIEERAEVIRRLKAGAEAAEARIKRERVETDQSIVRAFKKIREDVAANDDEVTVFATRSAHKQHHHQEIEVISLLDEE